VRNLIGAHIQTYRIGRDTTGYSGCILVFGSFAVMVHMFRVRSEIVLKLRSQQDSFWKRKRDEIILVIVTAALTFVATLLGTWRAGLLQPFP